MQGAVYQAFYGLETPAIFNCTSNCTWNDSYVSLGFSSACTNVTRATDVTKNCTSMDVDVGQSLNCTMTTPGNITFAVQSLTNHAGAIVCDTVLLIQAMSLYSLAVHEIMSPVG